MFTQLFGRIEHTLSFIKPYAEIFLCFNYLYTNTELSDVDDFGFDEVASCTLFEDISFRYDLSLGSMIQIFEYEETDEILDKLFLDLKVSYVQGGQTEYLKEGDLIRGNNNEILFDKTKYE